MVARHLALVATLLLASCGKQEGVPGLRATGSRLPASADELVAFVVGSGSCNACMSDSLSSYGPRLQATLAPVLADRGVRLTVLGVAADASASIASNFLTHAGPFDEIAAGRGWSNSVLQHTVRDGRHSFALQVPAIVFRPRYVSHTRTDIVSDFAEGSVVALGLTDALRVLQPGSLRDSVIALVRP